MKDLHGFLSFKEKQKKVVRRGKVLYDIKGHYKYIDESELLYYYLKQRLKSNL